MIGLSPAQLGSDLCGVRVVFHSIDPRTAASHRGLPQGVFFEMILPKNAIAVSSTPRASLSVDCFVSFSPGPILPTETSVRR